MAPLALLNLKWCECNLNWSMSYVTVFEQNCTYLHFFFRKPESEEVCVEINGCLEYEPQVLSARAMEILDIALTIRVPQNKYKLEYKYKWSRQLNLCKQI